MSDGARVNHMRSAADPLFVSAAEVFVIAQNEATSQVFSMPQATIATGHADMVLAIEDIGPALLRLSERSSLA